MAALAIAIVVLVGGGVGLMTSRVGQTFLSGRSQPPVSQTGMSGPHPVAPAQHASVIPRAPGHLGINAFPWAEVRSVRAVDDGQDVDLANTLVTPAQLDLTPGRYEITLSNPSFAKPITRTITVGSGEEARLDVQFSNADTAALPDFGASP
jgi:hypothetical protein